MTLQYKLFEFVQIQNIGLCIVIIEKEYLNLKK